MHINPPNLANINLTPIRPKQGEQRTSDHFHEIQWLYTTAKMQKKPDEALAMVLHLPTGIVHIKRAYTSKPGTLIFETYDDSSHTLMVVPIEQCVVSIHRLKEQNFEKPFMGFPSSPPDVKG